MPPTLVSRETAALQYSELRASYRAQRLPISVSFRTLAGEIGLGERLTHRLHSYPATLIRSIPAFFLAVPQLAPAGTTIGDPFCGSGTVLVESLCAGFDSYGLDINPLAALISRVKTTPLDPRRLARMRRALLLHRTPGTECPLPPVVNLQHWFYPNVAQQLAQIDTALQALPSGRYRDFFRVCFSTCVRRVSLANPRVTVPVRLRPDAYPPAHPLHDVLANRLNELRHVDAWAVLSRIIDDNLTRIERLSSLPQTSTSTVCVGDARDWDFPARPVSRPCDLVVTSPPYLGAQKYVRATSLSLNWLRLTAPADLRSLERATVGREHINADEYISFDEVPQQLRRILQRIALVNPLRAQIAAHYLLDLRRFFDRLRTWLVPNGHCVLIVGPNTVCGRPFNTPAAALSLAAEYGLSLTLELVDTILSRSLMTRRNRNVTAIDREHVLVLQRTGP